MFVLLNLTLLARTEVEIITRSMAYSDANDYEKKINKIIKERESNGWKLIDIKGFLTRAYNDRSKSEYILVFEK